MENIDDFLYKFGEGNEMATFFFFFKQISCSLSNKFMLQ